MKLIRSIAAGVLYRLQQYFEKTGETQYFQAAPALINAITELDLEALDLLEAAESDTCAPYHHLIELLGGAAGQNLLDLAVTVMVYPEFGNLLQSWRGHLVTPELAYFMENEAAASYDMLYEMYGHASKILASDGKAEPFYVEEFFADNRLLGYLNQSSRMDQRLGQAAELFLWNGKRDGQMSDDQMLPLMIHRQQCETLTGMLEDRQVDIWLQGGSGCGKKYVLRHAYAQRKQNLLFADVSVIFHDREQAGRLIWLIRREALLHACDVCLHGITGDVIQKSGLSAQEFLYRIAQPFWAEGIRLIFCTEKDVELIPYMERPVRLLEVEDATREERITLWQQYLGHYGLELDAVMLGSKYRLTPAEIHKAVMQLAVESGNGNKLTDELVQAKLMRILPPVLSKGTIEPRHANCTMDALVLPLQTKETILQICNHVRYSHQVFDSWNMESRFAYGKAVSVLLCGPPGTGKTMTARVLSDELGLPLYHVNLSQLVDKYIGETEKHLEEIFSNAEKNNLILFFDEADSVFSKRSQVTDAKDKYANTEVSFILQRLEAYDGIVILATNYLNNIDTAFLRRMQYTITFYLPGSEERRDLWEHMIPQECPTDHIDFDFLANQFELSGSSIKSAVLTAAFAAAGNGEALGMKHLIAGIKNEYQKKGKPVFAADFGAYGYLCQ